MDEISVEIVLKDTSFVSEHEIIQLAKPYLNNHAVPPGTIVSSFSEKDDIILHMEVDHIVVDENDQCVLPIDYCNQNIQWYVYQLDKTGPQSETAEDSSNRTIFLSTNLVLPSSHVFSLWENLIYEDNIKQKLLNYAYTLMKFTDKNVNSNVVSCNKVILLHGPPGTGKTSLCKALAQKLCIRMRKRYKQTVLIEINSHSLFSKWFSESGKLVSTMFELIREVIEVPHTLVCVLIDEVESLAHARDKCLSGTEPSDSIKVVNAVLTQIDNIKRYPNVIIFTTSNMTQAIDIAFVDRADVKQYIGPPGERAITNIYSGCLTELIRAGIIHYKEQAFNVKSLSQECQNLLIKVSKESVNLSGRMLRKIPFLAHALFLNKETDANLETFLKAMRKAVEFERTQKEYFLNMQNGI